jgi:N-acetyl-anhydromuramyl-L-alanine amidase AmpD
MGNLTPGAYTIDCLTYSKEAVCEVGQGYDRRPAGVVLDAVVLHSTNGLNASFNAQAAYLRDSPQVSIHYIVGEAGQLARVLDPGYWRAWQAGKSRYDEARFWPGRPQRSVYNGRGAWNDFSIGIELAHVVGTEYPPAQLTALRWLVNELRANYPAIRKEGIVLHRWIAGPNVRTTDVKVDPSDATDNWWRNWIQSL